ncbi:MAG: DUF4386 domain-containing protein [Bacteroidota bacterium]|nr:DUF4386 domain-containing protein [Bacteroidota bacterium]
MTPNKRTASIAGLLYLIVVMTGIFYLMYVPSKLIVWNNAPATFKNITDSEFLFRLGIFSGLICYVAFLFLPLVLYKLFKPVNKVYAVLMVAFALVSVPMAFINFGNEFSVLTLISKAEYLKAFEIDQLQAQVLLYLHYYNNGNQIISIFSGLWLFPLGYLIFKSGLLPKILGIFLMIGCFGYLIDFFAGLLFPGYNEMEISNYVILPASLGEIGTCLWLLIMGAKNYKQTLNSTHEK